MLGDLACQVRLGLRQPVRAIRDPAADQLASLGAAAPFQRCLVPLLVRAGPPSRLCGDLRGRLTDPSGPAGPITKRCRHPVLRPVATAAASSPASVCSASWIISAT